MEGDTSQVPLWTVGGLERERVHPVSAPRLVGFDAHTGCIIQVINFFPFSALPISSHFVPGNLLCASSKFKINTLYIIGC